MNISLPRVRRIAMIALGVAITALMVALFYANRDAAQATHSPADKVWASASTLETMHKTVNTTSNTTTEKPDEVVLARSKVKLSSPTDLILSVTSECALWTNTSNIGDDNSEARARVEVWITIDGKVVPVATSEGPPQPNLVPAPLGDSNDPADQSARQGRVVFCNRASRMTTENIESIPGVTVPNPDTGEPEPVPDADTEDDILIRSYNRTRTANAFNWGALDVIRNYNSTANDVNGHVVDIVVHARLAAQLIDEDTSDNKDDSPMAAAAVGKRTLFVQPTKMANDATL